MKVIREISGNTVPIYAWQSGSISGIIFLFGPEYLGGNGDLAKKLELINAVDENERYEEGQKVMLILSVHHAPAHVKYMQIYRRISGDLLSIPSLPPMYDYEFSPQAVSCNQIHFVFAYSLLF